MSADRLKQTFWVYTNFALYELIVVDEDRDVWKLYLKKKNYTDAMAYAKVSAYVLLISRLPSKRFRFRVLKPTIIFRNIDSFYPPRNLLLRLVLFSKK